MYEKTKLKFTQKLKKKRKEKKKKQEIIKNIKDTRKERETNDLVCVCVCVCVWYFGSFMLFSIQIIHNANSTQSLSPNPTQPTSNLTDPFPIFTSKILNHPFSIHLRSGSYIYFTFSCFFFSHTFSCINALHIDYNDNGRKF